MVKMVRKACDCTEFMEDDCMSFRKKEKNCIEETRISTRTCCGGDDKENIELSITVRQFYWNAIHEGEKKSKKRMFI